MTLWIGVCYIVSCFSDNLTSLYELKHQKSFNSMLELDWYLAHCFEITWKTKNNNNNKKNTLKKIIYILKLNKIKFIYYYYFIC